MNCSRLLGAAGTDYLPPVRAPLAAMDFVASVARRKRFVEVGSLRGDVIECVSHFASHATSIEADRRYCSVLKKRARANGRWTSMCATFSGSLVPMPAADWYFAWVPPHLDMALLAALREQQSSGRVPRTARFLLGFDTKVPNEKKMLDALSSLAERVTGVRYDERIAKPKGIYKSEKMASRMHGEFHIAQFDTWHLDPVRLEEVVKRERASTQIRRCRGVAPLGEPCVHDHVHDAAPPTATRRRFTSWRARCR